MEVHMSSTEKPSLYERLGGVYSIATVVDDFINRIMIDPRLNSNPLVDEAHHRYCSEPRLAFGRTVILRYRYELEARQYAPATINLRLAAVRRLAYKASDNGLLSPDL